MTIMEPGAIWMPSQWAWSDRPSWSPKPPNVLVIHATAGDSDAVSVAKYFQSDASQACSTYIIGTDGKLVCCAGEEQAHAANCCCTNPIYKTFLPDINGNYYSLAIEICKARTDNQIDLTEAQYQTLLPLVKHMCERNNIPRQWLVDASGGITTHSDFDPDHRAKGYDPGPFDWNRLFTYIKGGFVDLTNFPKLSQMTTITTDKQPSENAAWNCVYASIGMCIQYFRKQTGWDSLVNPDEIKDVVQGQGYIGGGDAALAVPFCAKFGLDLVQVKGTNTQLVAALHNALQAGFPGILTITSIYDSNWWHVHAVYKETSAPGLVAVDPYPNPAVDKDKSDATWINLLQSGSIWFIKPKGVIMGVPTGWLVQADGSLKCPTTTAVVKSGFADVVKNHVPQWPSWDEFLENEQFRKPLELSNPNWYPEGGQQQYHQSGALMWRSDTGVREEWIGKEAYFLRFDLLPKKDKEISDLKAQLAAKDAEIANLKASGAGHDPADVAHIASLQTSMQSVAATIEHIITEFEVEVIKLREDSH